MKFLDIGLPAQGGPMNGQSIVCKVAVLESERAYPAGMWTPEGWFYRLMFDENELPTHWVYDSKQNKAKVSNR